MEYRQKTCRHCGGDYIPTGPNSVFCSRSCKGKDRWGEERAKRAAAGLPMGAHGGNHGRSEWNQHLQTTRIATFEKRLRPLVKARGDCERCRKDLRLVGHFEWCVHHRDHDRTNNVIENMELLCKRCHQVEHRCWEAFRV